VPCLSYAVVLWKCKGVWKEQAQNGEGRLRIRFILPISVWASSASPLKSCWYILAAISSVSIYDVDYHTKKDEGISKSTV
jgi:hypothetical protein